MGSDGVLMGGDGVVNVFDSTYPENVPLRIAFVFWKLWWIVCTGIEGLGGFQDHWEHSMWKW